MTLPPVIEKLATNATAAIADAMPPIAVHRTLEGELLHAFEHMVDALRILDLLGQTGAAGALATAIALVTAEPEAWANDEMTAARFLERYEAYRHAVDQQRTDPKWATRPRHDF